MTDPKCTLCDDTRKLYKTPCPRCCLSDYLNHRQRRHVALTEIQRDGLKRLAVELTK